MIQAKKNLLLIILLSVPLLACTQNLKPNSKTEQVNLIKTNELEIIPSATSSQNDFEFYAGKWSIRNKKLKTLFNNCTEWIEFDAEEEIRPVLLGVGYIGHYKTILNNKPFEGLAIHLFNTETKLWSNYWADCNRGAMEVPVIGSFEKNIGIFYAKDKLGDKEIDLRFQWDVSDNDKPVWEQAFSDDGGKTWETNWIMNYYRK